MFSFTSPTGGPARHYNINPNGPRQPICGQSAQWGGGFARGYYTTDPMAVSCKKCMKAVAKMHTQARNSI